MWSFLDHPQDAMININPEDVSDELSSRSASPMPPDYLSHSSSPMPSSPAIIKESPVDPPVLQNSGGIPTSYNQPSASSKIEPTKSNICNSVPRSLPNKLDQVDGSLPTHSSENTPSGKQSGTGQITSDQSGKGDTTEDHTQVDSTVVDGGENKTIGTVLLATAAGAAAAAGAVYALMKR